MENEQAPERYKGCDAKDGRAGSGEGNRTNNGLSCTVYKDRFCFSRYPC